VLGFAKTWGGFSLLHPTAATTSASSLYSTKPQGQTFSKLVLLFEQKLD
jgi:hypothetical protein